MRILLVSDFFPPTPGGMEAHVQRLANALLQRGHEVAVVTSTAQPEPLPDRTVIVSTATILSRFPHLFNDDARPYPPPCTDVTLRRTVRRLTHWWRPDVIHAHGWCAFSCYWPSSPPLVVTLHDHGLRCPKRTLLRSGAECGTGIGAHCATCGGDQSALRRISLATALGHSARKLVTHTDRFIAVSRSVARGLAEFGPIAPKAEIVPNFLDVRDWTTGAPAHPPVILFVGPDSAYKGRPVAIEAFRRLPPGCAQLSLVGSTGPANLPGATATGYLRGSALRDQYQRASVVVVPSIWPEPCPTVALEAMACGRPVIGSRIGGIPDLVEDGHSGLLVEPNDPVSLAASLWAVLDDGRLRQRLGAGALARAAQFDTAAVVPQIEKIYAAVLRTGIAL